MTTIKSYTDLPQSKRLAEFLPIESADYFHAPDAGVVVTEPYKLNEGDETIITGYKGAVPCWSLAALHCVASTYCSRLEITLRADKKYNVFAVKDDFVFRSFDDHPDGFDNLVDACYEMVLKLKENNKL